MAINAVFPAISSFIVDVNVSLDKFFTNNCYCKKKEKKQKLSLKVPRRFSGNFAERSEQANLSQVILYGVVCVLLVGAESQFKCTKLCLFRTSN